MRGRVWREKKREGDVKRREREVWRREGEVWRREREVGRRETLKSQYMPVGLHYTGETEL